MENSIVKSKKYTNVTSSDDYISNIASSMTMYPQRMPQGYITLLDEQQ